MSRPVKRTRAHDVMIYLPSISGSIDPDSSTGGGGAETQMLLLARGLAELGARVCVAAYDDAGDLPDSIDGVNLIARAPYQARLGSRGKLREAVHIYESLAKGNAEVVLARVATPAIALVAWSAKLQRRRFVYSSANITDFDHAPVEPDRLNRTLVRNGLRLADDIIVQTEEQRTLCEERLGRTPVLIRSIAQRAPAREHEPEAFLWVARMASYKRPLAFVELARAVPEARFWMVCVPEPCEESRTLLGEVRQAAASVSNLELLPPLPRSELLALIGRSVTVVNTAEFEGLSNIFLEAWAQGVPGVALSYDPDGLIGRHGLGGFAGGSPTRLASIVRKLWETRHDQQELAGRCQDYLREHHAPSNAYAQWFETLGLGQASELGQPVFVGAA